MAKHKNKPGIQGQDNKNRGIVPKLKEAETPEVKEVIIPEVKTDLGAKESTPEVKDVEVKEVITPEVKDVEVKEVITPEVKTDLGAKESTTEVKDVEVKELDDNGKVLKNAIEGYLNAVVTVPEAKSLPLKESMIKTIVAVFKRPDLTQTSADVVNNAFKNEVHCAELPLLRGLTPSLHGIVSFIHAKLDGVNITIDSPIGNDEKIK